MTSRPSWDEYFMLLAQTTKLRSSCLRAQVGAVLVVERQIIATGYNGAPAGTPNCLEVGCQLIDNHCLRTVHAEQNAITQVAKRGASSSGSILYCTHRPCIHCTKLLINAGVSKIVYAEDYRGEDEESLFASELLAQAGVEVQQLVFKPN